MKVILIQPVKLSADVIMPPGETLELDDALAEELIGVGAAGRESAEASNAARDELHRAAAVAAEIGRAVVEAAAAQPERQRRKRLPTTIVVP